MGTEKIYEADLYEPIRKLFVQEGYEVNGEVKDCDITAVKDEELIIVEMKRNLTVELLIQAAKRQRLTDQVYIAIPKPKYKMYSKKWHDMCHLLKRLELGLIVVSFLKSGAKADIMLSPAPFDRKRSMQLNKKKRTNLLKEISGRSADYNVGGSNQTKIMTAYKENCIQIACYLDREGPTSPKNLRKLGTGDKTLSILTQNYYGWFEKVSRGIYIITEKGKQELKDYPQLVEYYLNKE
ncbi:DUF2161 family putative PD-(D/E)XK-type phosphodiesterase [Bacillus sp. FJAT-49736]|uniref:DUF2161 domain-containing phosphodiesterase n=1 Tax=Bacillus sp. FJAT-49736 TaxID=2833582 RepID=UPI001BC9DFCD|nr:DUF2161 family putative PD-(D/E)XK-type phosphodiesterase [Bacillus sp. FJAT-49736]MBS4174417.1 hypothetical protein [Bacillus sp. FJAT-49736]